MSAMFERCCVGCADEAAFDTRYLQRTSPWELSSLSKTSTVLHAKVQISFVSR